MGVLSVLLKRARAFKAPRVDIDDITDRAKIGILNTSIGLKPQDILTPAEVAARLKVPESWVYEKTRARCRNPMPCLRLGRYIRFDWNAVVNWLSQETETERHATRTNLPPKRKLVR